MSLVAFVEKSRTRLKVLEKSIFWKMIAKCIMKKFKSYQRLTMPFQPDYCHVFIELPHCSLPFNAQSMMLLAFSIASWYHDAVCSLDKPSRSETATVPFQIDVILFLERRQKKFNGTKSFKLSWDAGCITHSMLGGRVNLRSCLFSWPFEIRHPKSLLTFRRYRSRISQLTCSIRRKAVPMNFAIKSDLIIHKPKSLPI